MVWLLCLIALLRLARLSITHAATAYLAFHALFVSFRAIAIVNGAATLFSWPGASAVTGQEISRAVMLCDLVLAAMTCGWILAAHRAANSQVAAARDSSRALNPRIFKAVAGTAIPLGCIAMLLWSRFPGLPIHEMSGDWANSNWVVIAQTWTGLSLLALIYWYGFRPGLVMSIAIYFSWVVYQGNFRFRLLIPLILLVQIYLDRRGRRWPKLWGIAALVATGLLFFPLKGIGQRLQSNEPLDDLWQSTRAEIVNVMSGDHPDETILDQLASAITLADAHGRLYWGRTYAGLLTVAVPRQWWRQKPSLTEYQKEISTADRPMAQNGMVVTMLGEFYLNFSYFGVVVLSFVVAYLTGSWFHAAYRHGYFTLPHFTYLLVACNLIQVYRDGLISLFVFTIINMMPLTLIAALHLLRSPVGTFAEPILQTSRVREVTGRELSV
jgi:hypothetical protein